MAITHHLFLVSALLVSSMALVSGDKGTATFYTIYSPSACNENGGNGGLMIAAASEAVWDGGAACGRRYEVSCTSGTNLGVAHPCIDGASVVVTIVDYCKPPDCQGTIDLSEEAFAAIADEREGKISIDYHRV